MILKKRTSQAWLKLASSRRLVSWGKKPFFLFSRAVFDVVPQLTERLEETWLKLEEIDTDY